MLVLILRLTSDFYLIIENFWDFSLFSYTDYSVLILAMVFCLALGLLKISTYFKTNCNILTISAIITYMCIKSSQVAYYEDSQEKFMIGVLVFLGVLFLGVLFLGVLFLGVLFLGYLVLINEEQKVENLRFEYLIIFVCNLKNTGASLVSLSHSNTYVNGLETTIFESHAEFSNLFPKLNKLKILCVLILLMLIFSDSWRKVKDGRTLNFIAPECVPIYPLVAGFDYTYELWEEKPLYKKHSYKVYKEPSYKEYVGRYSIRTPEGKNSPELDYIEISFFEFSNLHAPLKLASMFLKSEIDWFREKDGGKFVLLPYDVRVSFDLAMRFYLECSRLTKSTLTYPGQRWQLLPWPKSIVVSSYSEFFERIQSDFHNQIYSSRYDNAGDVIESISLQIKRASCEENPHLRSLLELTSALQFRADPRCMPVFFDNQKNWSLQKDMSRIWYLCYGEVNQLILWFIYLTNGIKIFPCLRDNNPYRIFKSALFYRCTSDLTPYNPKSSKDSEPFMAQEENHFSLDFAYLTLEIYKGYCKNEKTAENVLFFKIFLATFGKFISYFQIPEQELISALFPEIPKSYKKGFLDFYFKFHKIFFDASAIDNYFKN